MYFLRDRRTRQPDTELFTFSPRAPVSSLRLLSEEETALAVEVERGMMMYMRDIPLQGNPALIFDSITEVLVTHATVADDAFCFLMKQTTANMQQASEKRGWELLCHILARVTPSRNLFPYVLQFIVTSLFANEVQVGSCVACDLDDGNRLRGAEADSAADGELPALALAAESHVRRDGTDGELRLLAGERAADGAGGLHAGALQRAAAGALQLRRGGDAGDARLVQHGRDAVGGGAAAAARRALRAAAGERPQPAESLSASAADAGPTVLQPAGRVLREHGGAGRPGLGDAADGAARGGAESDGAARGGAAVRPGVRGDALGVLPEGGGELVPADGSGHPGIDEREAGRGESAAAGPCGDAQRPEGGERAGARRGDDDPALLRGLHRRAVRGGPRAAAQHRPELCGCVAELISRPLPAEHRAAAAAATGGGVGASPRVLPRGPAGRVVASPGGAARACADRGFGGHLTRRETTTRSSRRATVRC